MVNDKKSDKVAKIMRKETEKKKSLRGEIRIDNIYSNLLRQFNLRGTARSVKVDKTTLLNRVVTKPSSLFYFCLFLGVSVGIGSAAFADKEVFPGEKPLDQPIRHAIESNDLPQAIPGDEKNVDIPPQNKKGEIYDEPLTTIPESKESDFSRGSVQSDGPKMDQKDLKKTTVKDVYAERNDGHENKVVSSSPPLKTEAGGQLPATAGNDLNRVLLGMFLALLGMGLLHRRRMIRQ